MTVDELYGPGSTARLELCMAVIPPFDGVETSVRQLAHSSGVHVITEWSKHGTLVGKYLVDYWQKTCHVSLLELQPAFKKAGLMTRLTEQMERFMVPAGITSVTLWFDERAEGKWVGMCGFEEFEDGRVGSLVPMVKPREHWEWVNAGRPPEAEPAWHAALRS